MARYIRNASILAKIESVYGTTPTPTGADNAMLISDFNINYQAQNVPRELVRPFMGGSEHLVGRVFVELTFNVEFASSGTAGTAPAYGPLLRACGFAETVTAARLSGKQPYLVTVRHAGNTSQVTTDWRAVDVRTGKSYAIASAVPREKRDYIDMLMVEGLAE